MMHETQSNNISSGDLLSKPVQLEPQLNSQGELISEALPQQNASVSVSPAQQAPLLECSYLDISLGDTLLAGPIDAFWPATDDSDLVHAIISCGHVLKSTHDLARWSEKTGARRVNGKEALDSITDLAVGLEAPLIQAKPQENPAIKLNNTNAGKNNGKYGGGRKRSRSAPQPISSGVVLKSTHDAATRSERTGAVNSSGPAGTLDLAMGAQGKQNQGGLQRKHKNLNTPRQPTSQVINSWPVLKSTHDAATSSEKRGLNEVNSAGTVGLLDDSTKNTQGQLESSKQNLQKGLRVSGGSLQSGLDTQAGSHVLLDGGKTKESPEKAIQALHLHV